MMELHYEICLVNWCESCLDIWKLMGRLTGVLLWLEDKGVGLWLAALLAGQLDEELAGLLRLEDIRVGLWLAALLAGLLED